MSDEKSAADGACGACDVMWAQILDLRSKKSALEARIAELSSENALMRPVVEAVSGAVDAWVANDSAAKGWHKGRDESDWEIFESSGLRYRETLTVLRGKYRAYEAALAARDGSEGLPSAYAGECEACGDTGSVPVADLDGEGSITEVACPLCAEKEEASDG